MPPGGDLREVGVNRQDPAAVVEPHDVAESGHHASEADPRFGHGTHGRARRNVEIDAPVYVGPRVPEAQSIPGCDRGVDRPARQVTRAGEKEEESAQTEPHDLATPTSCAPPYGYHGLLPMSYVEPAGASSSSMTSTSSPGSTTSTPSGITARPSARARPLTSPDPCDPVALATSPSDESDNATRWKWVS